MTTPKTKTTKKKAAPRPFSILDRLEYLEERLHAHGSHAYDLSDKVQRIQEEAKAIAWFSLGTCFVAGAAIITSIFR